MLPEPVLAKVQSELLEFGDARASVMEISHRGAAFGEIAAQAEADLRALLDIGDEYAVLFLQGGATAQFSQLAMNLSAANQSADYLITGSWGKKAMAEASNWCQTRCVASAEADGFRGVPDPSQWDLDPDAAYLHITPNETIVGVALDGVPRTAEVPVVADMSSCILSEPLDVSRFGLIYAGAQKNIGPAGMAIVIVQRALLGHKPRPLPGYFDYRVQDAAGSMFNTPPTFAWYVAGEVFKWLVECGGVQEMKSRNRAKAALLYACIDASAFYANPVDKPFRSMMNIPFTLADSTLDQAFLSQATEAGLLGLKGHRLVGGMRASIYNAMPLQGVQALTDFMRDFEQRQA